MFPDGSVVVVELLGGRITRVWNGRKEVVSAGSAPGPMARSWGRTGRSMSATAAARTRPIQMADPNQTGRIERVDLSTGKFERLYDHVGDVRCLPPTTGVRPRGRHVVHRFRQGAQGPAGRSGIYYAKPDGSEIREVVYGGTGYNGIGLSPDGKWLYYAMNYTGRLFRMRIEGPGKVAMQPGDRKSRSRK